MLSCNGKMLLCSGIMFEDKRKMFSLKHIYICDSVEQWKNEMAAEKCFYAVEKCFHAMEKCFYAVE